jgi:hypothetical protein
VDRAEFKRRNQAQMDRAKGGLQQVAREFVRLIAADAVEATPGFGNQHDNTEYIPTGRLRGGWNYTRTPIGQSAKGLLAGRTEEGPFSDYGRETVARIAAQLQAATSLSWASGTTPAAPATFRRKLRPRRARPRPRAAPSRA